MEGTPNAFTGIAQGLFALGVVLAFLRLPPRHAVLAGLIGGFLFLPVFDNTPYELPFLRTKETYIGGVVLLASLALDRARWRGFRPAWVDLPTVVFCLAPIATSLSNDLGLYDGVQGAFELAMAWGAPYVLGKRYLGSAQGMRDFADATLLGGLAYVPLSLWEVRMSPHLHHTVYGYRPYAGFSQSVRFGGFRPTVFMDHGLMVGMFLAGTALVATWMWMTRTRRTLLGLPMGWVAVILGATSLLTKSVGSNLLLAAGLVSLAVARRLRTPALVLLLAAVPPVYAASRIGGWSAQEVSRLTADVINADRAQSVAFRVWNENMLIEKALERPYLGWGRWGRGRVYNEEGKDISTTDGRWVIALSVGGFVGLVASLLIVLVPVLAAWRVLPARRWADPGSAAAAVLLVWLLLWGIDNLANSMPSPIYPMVAGALAGMFLLARDGRRRSLPEKAVARRRPRVRVATPAGDHVR